MAEDIAESGVDARIETAANCIKRQETEAAGAGGPSQGRRHRIQSRDELRDDENRRPITGKSLFSPAIMGVRIACEAVNEVQHLVAVPATRLVPWPVTQDRGNDRQTEHGEEAQLPGGGERPGGEQKQRSRYRQAQLVRE